MLFSQLMDEQLDDGMKPFVSNLLAKKTETSEIGEGKKIDVLNDYIERQFELISAAIDAMAPEDAKSWEKLNDLFRRSLEMDG